MANARAAGMKLFFSETLSKIVSSKVKKEMMSDVRYRIAEYYQSKGKHLKAIAATIRSIIIQPSHAQTKMKIFFLMEYIPGFKLLWKPKR